MAASKLTGSRGELMLKYMSSNPLFCCVLSGWLPCCFVCLVYFFSFISLFNTVLYKIILAIQCNNASWWVATPRQDLHDIRWLSLSSSAIWQVLFFIPQGVVPPSSPAINWWWSQFSRQLPNHAAGYTELNGTSSTGLLIGCGKKWEILWHFQGKWCGKKGLLCGKLCNFFKADLTLFF